MGQAIEHGGGHLGVVEHFRPIGEGEICGGQQRGLFGDSFFGDIVGILHSVRSGFSCRHHRSPAQARKPAGQDPTRALGALRGPKV
jgi:hypothetical protein